MLGDLSYLFGNIGSKFKEDDNLACLIKKHLTDILTSVGIKELNNKKWFFAEITSWDKRNTYRNPPAHTKYLPYKTACECRELVREIILKFEKMFKL